jgi:hypothetical protein
MPRPRETIAEFVAPAGNPSLAAIASDASGCKQYTVADPSKGVHQTGAIQVVPTPAVPAENTLGLKTTTVTTTAGGPPVTTVQTDYLAETKGTLVTINTKGGPTGNPIDPTVVAAAFTKAVPTPTCHGSLRVAVIPGRRWCRIILVWTPLGAPSMKSPIAS